MTYGFLPFTILPLYVAIDRLDPNLVQAARDLYASGRGGVRPRDAAADDARRGGGRDPHVHPDARRLRHARPAGRRPDDDDREGHPERVPVGTDWPFGAALGFLMIALTIIGTLAGLRFLRREVIG